MSPATAGPARSAERAMLASILGLLIDIGGLWRFGRKKWVGMDFRLLGATKCGILRMKVRLEKSYIQDL
jgi:hypothetical protein